MKITLTEILLGIALLVAIIYIVAIVKYFTGDPSWIYTLKMLDTRSPIIIINK